MLHVHSSPRAKRMHERGPSLTDITNILQPPLSIRDKPAPHTTRTKSLRRTNRPSLARRARSPISRLPAELLLHIAALGTLEHFSFPLLFSHVCRHWRGLALNTHSLWSTLVLSTSFDDVSSPRYIDSMLVCSQATPLDIRLDMGMYRKGLDAGEAVFRTKLLMDMVQPHAGRWRSLTLSLPSLFDIDDFLRRCLPHARLLERLTLHRCDRMPFRPSKADPFLRPDDVHLPRLQHFQIDGLPLPSQLALHTLTALTALHILSVPVDVRPSTADVLSILRALPDLRHLTLYACLPPASPATLVSLDRLPLQHLRTLDLSHNPVPAAQHILFQLHTPSLHSLILGSSPSPTVTGPEDLAPLAALITCTRYPALRWLRLGFGALEDPPLAALTARMGGVCIFGPAQIKDTSVQAANRRWQEAMSVKVAKERRAGKKRWFS